jgi:Leucine-rich repeat (LRR) protein
LACNKGLKKRIFMKASLARIIIVLAAILFVTGLFCCVLYFQRKKSEVEDAYLQPRRKQPQEMLEEILQGDGWKTSEVLDLGELELVEFDKRIVENKRVHTLILSHNILRALSEEIGNMRSLRELDLQANDLSVLPDSFVRLNGLLTLNLSNNRKMRGIPEQLRHLRALEELRMANCEISDIPKYIEDMSSLVKLDLSWNPISDIPINASKLQNLEEINFSYCRLVSFPKNLSLIESAKVLYLQGNHLVDICSSIGKMASLLVLNISYNRLASLPPLSALRFLRELDLSGNPFLVFPGEITNMEALEVLKMNATMIDALPASIKSLRRLRVLKLNHCKNLRHLPIEVLEIDSLKIVHLKGSMLEEHGNGRDTIGKKELVKHGLRHSVEIIM